MPLLGCIADDFTGATDLASMLVRNGMRAVQLIGVPGDKSPALRAVTDAYGARLGIDLTPDHSVDNISMMVSLVAATGGIALAPLYARNLLSFLTPLIDKESKNLKINWEDEIVKACTLTRDGAIVHPNFV